MKIMPARESTCRIVGTFDVSVTVRLVTRQKAKKRPSYGGLGFRRQGALAIVALRLRRHGSYGFRVRSPYVVLCDHTGHLY